MSDFVLTPFDPVDDLCLGFFAEAWNSGRCPFTRYGAKVLELGCAEADWLRQMRAVRPDLHLTGIDQRNHPRPVADVHLVADIFTADFPAHAFDVIIAVSTIEWAGIGYYGDTVRSDGDSEMMRLAHRWIRPDGWMYFDVPWNEKKHTTRGPGLRAYSEVSLQERLYQGLWRETSRADHDGRRRDRDGRLYHHDGKPHPDGPYRSFIVRPIQSHG